MQNEPRYQLQSVGNALILIRQLQEGEVLQVSTVSRRLEVGRSTAHRLLSMLVQHGFAVQGPHREYLRGPSLQDPQVVLPSELSLTTLRRQALPILHALTQRAQETSNVQLVQGDHSRVLASVECARPLRVSNREGQSLPSHLSSGGRAVNRSGLSVIGQFTFVINDQDIEEGITAIGMAVDSEVVPDALAVSIAMPSVRYDDELLLEWLPEIAFSTQALAEAIRTDYAIRRNEL